MKEPKMTKEEKELFNQDEIIYNLNREHIKKIDEFDLKLVAPRYCETEATTEKHVIKVITYVMNRKSYEEVKREIKSN